MDILALNFVIVYKPAFTTTKWSICGIGKIFPEKTSILFFFFSGFKREISSSCRQLGAGCPNLLRRTILEELFLDKRRKKTGIWVTVFRLFGRTVRRGVSKYSIQHHQMNNLREKNSEKVFTLYICFQAWRTKSCSFGAKPKQVVKSCPED